MTQQPMDSRPAKSNRTPIIIGVVVVVLLCCCVIGAAAAYYGYNAYSKSGIQQQLQSIPSSTDQPSIPGLDAGMPPQGGLTDGILRQDIWKFISPMATAMGCEPDAANSTIEVTTKPDASGLWSEKWTVACKSGGTKAFQADFTPSAGGGTDYSIKPLP